MYSSCSVQNFGFGFRLPSAGTPCDLIYLCRRTRACRTEIQVSTGKFWQCNSCHWQKKHSRTKTTLICPVEWQRMRSMSSKPRKLYNTTLMRSETTPPGSMEPNDGAGPTGRRIKGDGKTDTRTLNLEFSSTNGQHPIHGSGPSITRMDSTCHERQYEPLTSESLQCRASTVYLSSL